ncbi:sensor histidine kinase [Fulvivirga sediminis]|uniref:histidine kinase n=1 Tax=Fulvivirga sediminis TaxID=2803949 RepID=A0A937K089_9BACT|nr:ATP-binding protein [Fulvivirga sediminis]MBL3658118.1 GHKL domain-containing protein [Fulvivirga sediminis]
MRALFILIISAVITLTSYSQSFQKTIYGVEEGLVTHLIKAVEFDSLGFLWVGTDEGLVRYDGREFQNYPQATPSRYIKDIIYTGNQLLAVSDLGITEIVPGISEVQFKEYFKGSIYMSDSTLWYPKKIFIDSKSNKWVSEPASVVKLQGKRLTRYTFDASEFSHSFLDSFSFFEMEDELYVIAYGGRMYRYDEEDDEFKRESLKSDIPLMNVNVCLDLGDTILVGNISGVHKVWRSEDGFHGERVDEIPVKEVANIVRYDSTQILIGTFQNELLLVKERDLSVQDKYDILRSNDILVNSDGHFWVGSDEGLVMLKKNYFRQINNSDHYIEAIMPLDDKVYYSHKDALIKLEHNEDGYEQSTIVTGNNEFFIAIAGIGSDVWVSNKFNILHLQEDVITDTVRLSNQMSFVSFMYADSKHNLWIHQQNMDGICKLDPEGVLKHYKSKDGVDGMLISGCEVNGTLYFGGIGEDSYLYRYDEKSDRFVNESVPISFELSDNFEISDLAARNDTLWLASTDGVIQYVNGTVNRLELGSMTTIPVRAVALESEFVWLVNTMGVVRVDLTNMQSWISFDKDSGLPSSSGNPRDLRVDDNGTKWVGTALGLSSSIQGGQKFNNTQKPFLTDLIINGREWSLDDISNKSIPNHSIVELHFLSLTFPGSLLTYQYKINDSAPWADLELNNIVKLNELDAGTYTLQIRARQSGNYLWSESEKIEFTVAEPFYSRRWFVIACIVTAFIVIYALSAYYSYRLRKAKDKLNAIVEDRTAQLKLSNQQLRQTNKELDMFVYSASHDLKAPLSSMIGLLNLYNLETTQESKDELIQRMRESILKLDSFIKDVIAYSKNSRLDVIKEEIDFNEIISEVFSVYKYLNHFNKIKRVVRVERGVYFSDKNRLRIIFNNLISNSIRYCDTDKEDSLIEILVSKKDNFIYITVTDNGIGIPEQYLSNIFDMFFRADESRSGSGLGLYIVKEAVTLLNGEIEVESTFGQGTSFNVKLPA